MPSAPAADRASTADRATERLGFTGREEGIAAFATVLLVAMQASTGGED
ncbi:MAG: hypothetical protein ACM3NZ_01395 [Betaproteobacteria bacterium]